MPRGPAQAPAPQRPGRCGSGGRTCRDCRTLRGVPVDGQALLERLALLPRGRAVVDASRSVPGVFLVGGALRDLALGIEPREIDLAVEGDPDPLLAALGGADVEHE